MRSAMCTSCGYVSWADGGNCKQCGTPLPADGPRPGLSDAPPQDFGASHDYDGQGPTHEYFGEPAKKRKGHAVASLVLGLVGFFTFGIVFIGSVVGTILGVVALRKESTEPARYGGKGLAVAGIVTNVLALVMVFPLSIIAAVAIPNLLAARRAANEASAVNTIRTITVAETAYQSAAAARSLGDLKELADAGLMPEIPNGKRNGYRFTLVKSGDDYSVSAMPLPNAGRRSFFYSSSDGEIHVRLDGLPATADDPPLEYYDNPQQQQTRRPLRGPVYIPR